MPHWAQQAWTWFMHKSSSTCFLKPMSPRATLSCLVYPSILFLKHSYTNFFPTSSYATCLFLKKLILVKIPLEIARHDHSLLTRHHFCHSCIEALWCLLPIPVPSCPLLAISCHGRWINNDQQTYYWHMGLSENRVYSQWNSHLKTG